MPTTQTFTPAPGRPTPVRLTAIVASTENTQRMGRVIADPCEGYQVPAGMFLIDTGTPDFPYYSYGMLTGRTRRIFGMDCPTITRFEVETVANAEGVILGEVGGRITGTWFTRPENVL